LFERHPHLAAVDAIAPGEVADIAALAALAGGAFDDTPFGHAVADFYLSNPIARASTTMAQCSALAAEQLPMAAE
jgi:NADH-quinone oxidoreductase subunit G